MSFIQPLVVNTKDWWARLFDVDGFLMKMLGDDRVDLLEIKKSWWNNFPGSAM